MQDRIPLYPGRVTMTPVSGQTNTFDMVRADQPQVAGTPLSKANLLSDRTATALGLTPATATPDDAFNALLSLPDQTMVYQQIFDYLDSDTSKNIPFSSDIQNKLLNKNIYITLKFDAPYENRTISTSIVFNNAISVSLLSVFVSNAGTFYTAGLALKIGTDGSFLNITNNSVLFKKMTLSDLSFSGFNISVSTGYAREKINNVTLTIYVG